MELLIHTTPPTAHTVEVEPITPADWELIELHSEWLETNFLSQIRAVPHPDFKPAANDPPSLHPLVLNLSPTFVANVSVKTLKLEVEQMNPPRHVRIEGADCEVHVVPKPRYGTETEDQSTQSADSKSRVGSGKIKSTKTDMRPVKFLRGVSRCAASDWFDENELSESDEGLKIWIDSSVLISKEFHGFAWVWVSVARPLGLTCSAEEAVEAVEPASRVVAQLCAWENAPNAETAAVATQLCASLDAKNMVGEILRIEVAPPQVSKSAVRSLMVHPFAESVGHRKDGFRFGSKLRADQQYTAQRLLTTYNGGKGLGQLLQGPITDGMLLAGDSGNGESNSWPGGIIKFHPPPGPPVDGQKPTRSWLLGSDRRLVAATPVESSKLGSSDRRLNVEVSSEMVHPSWPSSRWNVGDNLPERSPLLVGTDVITDQVTAHMHHSCSTLLTGGPGSGKTTVCQFVAHHLQWHTLVHVIFFSCRSLMADEMRVTGVKDAMSRLFALASWSARLGGKSVVILDDLDMLCPAENELEVGNENNRNRQVSEIVRSIVHKHCALSSRVCLLATTQSKEALHNILISGHVVREYVHLPAPDKDKRRKVLECLAEQDERTCNPMNGTDETAPIDYLDIAGQTDGYMPGDLKLLVSRARSEAMIRSLSTLAVAATIPLLYQDFSAALKGFTPVSLRSVSLQNSSTSFSSIGGLKSTRQMLLETLQYPTLYAPIFANCPLRLRSGLLLYGYPGCGKTLLASAVAGECGLNFISVKGPEILNKYIGASEKSVRDLFERAEAARPCVLFFDEFDSVAPKRGHDSTGVTDRVVNQLLTQMDGAEGLSGVYVLAATSRPDLIDPALLRPGRLDKSLLCEMPDLEAREDIIQTLGSQLRMGQDARNRFNEIAMKTEGYTGADLQAVVYNAHLEAIHDAMGDQDMQAHARQGAAAVGRRDSPNRLSIPDFAHFRMDETNNMPRSDTHRAGEKSQVAQLLRSFKLAQHKAKAARRDSFKDGSGGDERVESRDVEPTIHWAHLKRALQQTRPSVSPEEVQRLDKIYRNFVASRNGEMPSGQGGNDIGGRSSLM